jgi:hypothetical protein
MQRIGDQNATRGAGSKEDCTGSGIRSARSATEQRLEALASRGALKVVCSELDSQNTTESKCQRCTQKSARSRPQKLANLKSTVSEGPRSSFTHISHSLVCASEPVSTPCATRCDSSTPCAIHSLPRCPAGRPRSWIAPAMLRAIAPPAHLTANSAIHTLMSGRGLAGVQGLTSTARRQTPVALARSHPSIFSSQACRKAFPGNKLGRTRTYDCYTCFQCLIRLVNSWRRLLAQERMHN